VVFRRSFLYSASAWILGLVAVLFGLAVWLALPRMVIVMDDDFWYLKSVVETFQRGRPWTAEWLTPWGATSSMLVAGLTWLTGSFSFGVHFYLALSGATACLGMAAYLRASGGSLVKSAVLPWLVLGTPTVFFMLLMFTSVAIYLACLWWCLFFAKRRLWGWFFVVWGVGFASRQSAIVWMTIPAWEWLMMWWQRRNEVFRRGSEGWKFLAMLAGGAVMLAVMKWGMNETHGQKAVLSTIADQLTPKSLWRPMTLGMLSILTGLGLGLLLRPGGQVRPNPTRWLLAAVLMPAGAALGVWAKGQMIGTHAVYGDQVSTWGFAVWGVLAGAGLALRAGVPSMGLIATALGSVLLVSLYAGVFDYYYIDAFFFSIAAGLAARPQGGDKVVRASVRWQGAMLLLVIFVAQGAWNGRGYVRMKYAQDRYAAILELAERNVRAGRLDIQETGFAGFGYSGWKLENHFRENEGKDISSIAGFVEYSRPFMWNGETGTGVITTYPKSFKRYRQWLPSHNAKGLSDPSTAVEQIDQIERPLLWCYKATFALRKVPSPTLSSGLSGYRDERFPLNDQEWWEWLHRNK
jgi:hypothetical protein